MRNSLGLAAAAMLAFAGAAEASDGERQGNKVNIFLHGGIGGYTGGLAGVTEAGPTWGLTVNLLPWNILGYEINYDGSRNLIEDPRLADEPSATRHGLSGVLKLAPHFTEKVRPFIGAGLGATFVNIGRHSDGLYDDDLMEELPLTGGLEFNTGALTAGVRGTYRWLFDESFADPSVPGNLEGGYLDAAVTLGGRF